MSTAGAIKAGRAFVELFADKSPMIRVLNQTSKEFGRWGKNLATMGASLAAGGFGVGAGIVALVKSFADAGSQIDDVSQRTGVAVESLGELQYAAVQNGSSLEDLEGGFKNLGKFIVSVAEGNKEATGTLDTLGVSLSQLKGLSPDKQFELLADKIASISNPAVKASMAMKVFGKSGLQLLPLLDQGSAGIAEFRAEAQRLGLVMSKDEVTAAAAAGDAFDKMFAAIRAVTNTVGAAFAPILTTAADAIIDFSKNAAEWIRENKGLATTIAAVVAGALALGAGLAVIGVASSTIGAGIGLLTGTFTKLASTILSVPGMLKGVFSVVTAIPGIIASVFTAGAGIISGIFGVVTAIPGLIIGAFSAIGGIVATVGGALAGIAAPVAIAVAVIAGVALAVTAAVYAFPYISSAATKAASVISGVFASVKAAVSPVIAGIQSVVSGVLSFIGGIPGIISGKFSILGTILAGVASHFKPMIMAGRFVIDTVMSIPTMLKSAFGGLSSLFGGLSGMVGNVFSVISGAFNSLPSAMSVVQGLLGSIGGLFGYLQGAGSSAMGMISDAFNGVMEDLMGLYSIAKIVIGGIVAALGKGDITTAWNIITTALEVGWLEAVGRIKSAWSTLSDYLMGAIEVPLRAITIRLAEFAKAVEALSGIDIGKGALKGLDDSLKERKRAREQRANAGPQTNPALEDAKMRLGALLVQAHAPAAASDGIGAPKKKKTGGVDPLDDISLRNRTIKTAGTFNAFGVAGLGVNNTQERTAKATEATAKHTKDTATKIAKLKPLAFGT